MIYRVGIATGDLHISIPTELPQCRTEKSPDDFFRTMRGKLGVLHDAARKFGGPCLYAGDIFNDWRCGHNVTAFARDYLPPGYAVCGQHELPYHDIAEFERSPVRTLANNIVLLRAECQQLYVASDELPTAHTHPLPLYGMSWGEAIPVVQDTGAPNILVMHRTMWHPDEPLAGGVAKDGNARAFLEMHPEFKLVICGDNHKEFTVEIDGRVFLNCGSMLRLAADQVTHIPRFHKLFYDDGTGFYTTSSETFATELIPISREHIDNKIAKEERDFVFVTSLKEHDEAETLDFTEKLRSVLEQSDVGTAVERRVWKYVDTAKETLR